MSKFLKAAFEAEIAESPEATLIRLSKGFRPTLGHKKALLEYLFRIAEEAPYAKNTTPKCLGKLYVTFQCIIKDCEATQKRYNNYTLVRKEKGLPCRE